MEDNKFLSVKEFAERAAVSVQSVYKRINKPDDIINKYTQTIDKKIYISERAIEDIYNNSVAEPAEPAEPAAPVAPAENAFCPNCGAAKAEGAGFCAECGTKLS